MKQTDSINRNNRHEIEQTESINRDKHETGRLN